MEESPVTSLQRCGRLIHLEGWQLNETPCVVHKIQTFYIVDERATRHVPTCCPAWSNPTRRSPSLPLPPLFSNSFAPSSPPVKDVVQHMWIEENLQELEQHRDAYIKAVVGRVSFTH